MRKDTLAIIPTVAEIIKNDVMNLLLLLNISKNQNPIIGFSHLYFANICIIL